MTLCDGGAVWGLHATHGFPLEITLIELADRGYVPSWDRLIMAAEADGSNVPRLFDQLRGYVAAYGDSAATIREGLNRLEICHARSDCWSQLRARL